MKPKPLLIIGDAPERVGGLSRITRDLATLISTLPEFRVGVYGRGGRGSRHLPFAVYSFDERDQWGEETLPVVWNDFAGRERGIILTIWDASRLDWFALPQYINGPLGDFLRDGHFERWGYFPIDSTGPQDRLTGIACDILRAYDRVLAYTMWGQQQIQNSTGRTDVDWMPHGIDLNVFRPRDKQAGRRLLGSRVHEDDIVIGCVMTNQPRKDWGTAFETFRLLQDQYKHIRFWCHTDALQRSNGYSLYALAADFGVGENTIITMNYSDEQLVLAYSACDLTILPSVEGFGYPIVESLACGTPVIHSSYGGGAELVPRKSWLVDPIAYRLDTLYNARRPVFRASDWLNAINKAKEEPSTRDECTKAVEHLRWDLLFPATFKKWMLVGL